MNNTLTINDGHLTHIIDENAEFEELDSDSNWTHDKNQDIED